MVKNAPPGTNIFFSLQLLSTCPIFLRRGSKSDFTIAGSLLYFEFIVQEAQTRPDIKSPVASPSRTMPDVVMYSGRPFVDLEKLHVH